MDASRQIRLLVDDGNTEFLGNIHEHPWTAVLELK